MTKTKDSYFEIRILKVKSVKAFLISSILFFLILNFFRYLLKISYNNFHTASDCILVIAICFSAIAVINIGNKNVFNVIFVAGYATCNLLFISILFAGNWATSLMGEIKWSFVLSQFIFVLLIACRRLYNKAIEDDLLLNLVDKLRNIYPK